MPVDFHLIGTMLFSPVDLGRLADGQSTANGKLKVSLIILKKST